MSVRHRYPFTATQWEELEHQALIFKYMVSGIPVPAHLLYSTLQTSCCSFNTPPAPPPPPQQQHMIGWNGFQMGLGKKVDPEPGRCRRTDGKKWRCSKETHPDSKYCERHMHRGKNRSRKPVEFPLITPVPNAKSRSSNFDGYSQPSGEMMMRRSFHGNLLPMEGSWPQLSVGGGHDHYSSSAGSSISSSSSSSCSSWRVQKQSDDHHHHHDNQYWAAAGDNYKAQEERTVHRFFDEGPPHKNQLQDQQQYPWKQQLPSWEDRSTTKLSISIPSSTR